MRCAKFSARFIGVSGTVIILAPLVFAALFDELPPAFIATILATTKSPGDNDHGEASKIV